VASSHSSEPPSTLSKLASPIANASSEPVFHSQRMNQKSEVMVCYRTLNEVKSLFCAVKNVIQPPQIRLYTNCERKVPDRGREPYITKCNLVL
jgi:hypothetical protein